MDFSDIIATFVGRNVESFSEGQFLTGDLIGVTEGTIVMNVDQSIYSLVSGQVHVLNPSIYFVRILP